MTRIHAYTSFNMPTESIFKDKGSKFYGYGYKVLTEIEIKEKLTQLRELHPKSRHVCYAYRLGTDGNNYRAVDDGEPSGSAGKPILGQIDKEGITNAAIFVVRYFGGTKLGISGLIAAYKTTALQLFENHNAIAEFQLSQEYNLETQHINLPFLMPLINKFQVKVIEEKYDTKASFVISIEMRNELAFFNALEKHHDKEFKIKPPSA